MPDEPTKEQVAERAREIARRTMAQPAQPQEWPKKDNPAKTAKTRKQRKATRAKEDIP